MKTQTNTFKIKKRCMHSVVFEPTVNTADKPAIATSIYVSNAVIPTGASECKITVSWPDGGGDSAYNAL